MLTHITQISLDFDLPFLPHIMRHYSLPEVTERLYILHSAHDIDRETVRSLEREYPSVSFTTHAGPYFSRDTTRRVNLLREQSANAWVLWTDADEFLTNVDAIPGLLADRSAESGPLWTRLVDRWHTPGVLRPVERDRPLAKQFPLRAETTFECGANDLKPCLVHKSAEWTSPHQVRGCPDPARSEVACETDHYKWTACRTAKITRQRESVPLNNDLAPGSPRFGEKYMIQLAEYESRLHRLELPWPVFNVGLNKAGTTTLCEVLQSISVPATHDKQQTARGLAQFAAGQGRGNNIFTEAKFAARVEEAVVSGHRMKLFFTQRDKPAWVESALLHVLWCRVSGQGTWTQCDTQSLERQWDAAQDRLKRLRAAGHEVLVIDIPDDPERSIRRFCHWLGLPTPEHVPIANSGRRKLERLLADERFRETCDRQSLTSAQQG